MTQAAPDRCVVWEVGDQGADAAVGQGAPVEVEQVDPVPEQIGFEGVGGGVVREQAGDGYRFPRPNSRMIALLKSSASPVVLASARKVSY